MLRGLVAKLQEHTIYASINRLVEDVLRESLPAEGEVITQEHIAKIASFAAERFTEHEMRLPRRETLTPEALLALAAGKPKIE